MPCLISNISTLLLSLSVNFSNRDVILNLALLQSLVNTCNLLWQILNPMMPWYQSCMCVYLNFPSSVNFCGWSGDGLVVLLSLLSVNWSWQQLLDWILQCCKDLVVNSLKLSMIPRCDNWEDDFGDIHWPGCQFGFWLCWGAWPFGHVPSNQYWNAFCWWNLPCLQANYAGPRPTHYCVTICLHKCPGFKMWYQLCVWGAYPIGYVPSTSWSWACYFCC
jgi:hypothetical protein